MDETEQGFYSRRLSRAVSADNAPKNIELIGARREKDGMSALVRNSELPAGVESAPAGLEDIMVHIEREGETK